MKVGNGTCWNSRPEQGFSECGSCRPEQGLPECGPCRPEHSFAVCAYGDSPYLERCLRSLKAQTAASELLICTSTPSPFISGLAEKYGIPLYVRDGVSGIGADWNFAFDTAKGRFVTLAHQDDMYEKHYTERLLSAARRWPDMTLFTTSSVTVKNGTPQPARAPEIVKKLLRIPLRFRRLADRTAVKRLVLQLGNAVMCPTCAYRKDVCGESPFSETHKFILDWEFLWDLAGRGGRWICDERPGIFYRIHGDAATASCIGSNVRETEEREMFRRMWPEAAVKLILHFYRRSYDAYTEKSTG